MATFRLSGSILTTGPSLAMVKTVDGFCLSRERSWAALRGAERLSLSAREGGKRRPERSRLDPLPSHQEPAGTTAHHQHRGGAPGRPSLPRIQTAKGS